MKKTILEKLYPNHKIKGLPEIFVAKVGWYSTLITNKEEIKILAKRHTDAVGREIEKMCLLLEDELGNRKRADFLPKELLNI